MNNEPAHNSILDRVASVKASVPDLIKSEYNKHNDYYFAGIDQIYDALRVLMAEAGLDVRCDIVSCERYTSEKNKVWIDIVAKLSFESAGGSEQPVTRHLAMAMNGPQSYEAAISYLVKQFLRQRLMLSTGERDADASYSEPPAPNYKVWIEDGKLRQSHEPPKAGTEDRRMWCGALYQSIEADIKDSKNPRKYWDDVKPIAKEWLPEIGYHALISMLPIQYTINIGNEGDVYMDPPMPQAGTEKHTAWARALYTEFERVIDTVDDPVKFLEIENVKQLFDKLPDIGREMIMDKIGVKS